MKTKTLQNPNFHSRPPLIQTLSKARVRFNSAPSEARSVPAVAAALLLLWLQKTSKQARKRSESLPFPPLAQPRSRGSLPILPSLYSSSPTLFLRKTSLHSHGSGGQVAFTGQADTPPGVQPWPHIILRDNLALKASVSPGFTFGAQFLPRASG